MPAGEPQAGEVHTTGNGSRGRCTQHTSPPCPLRTNTFEARYPPALLPWTVLPTNFTPAGGRGHTTPRGCGCVHHWHGNATLPGTQPQIFALIKIDLGICYFFIPLNCHLHHQGKDIKKRRQVASPTTQEWMVQNTSHSPAPQPGGWDTSCWSICRIPVWIRQPPKSSPKTNHPPYWRPWTDPNWSAQF